MHNAGGFVHNIKYRIFMIIVLWNRTRMVLNIGGTTKKWGTRTLYLPGERAEEWHSWNVRMYWWWWGSLWVFFLFFSLCVSADRSTWMKLFTKSTGFTVQQESRGKKAHNITQNQCSADKWSPAQSPGVYRSQVQSLGNYWCLQSLRTLKENHRLLAVFSYNG